MERYSITFIAVLGIVISIQVLGIVICIQMSRMWYRIKKLEAMVESLSSAGPATKDSGK